MKPNIDVAILKTLIDYNPETGAFFWKERTILKPQDKVWNKRFANKQTGYLANIHGFKCVQIRIHDKLYRAHRIAWAYVNGDWPKEEIDHINLDPTDNRIVNLRLADRSQNECNKKIRIDNKLGVKGVFFDENRKKYMVQLKFKNNKIRKRVSTLEEERDLYAALVSKFHGEFGRVL